MMLQLPPKSGAESIGNSFWEISTSLTVSAKEISIASIATNV